MSNNYIEYQKEYYKKNKKKLNKKAKVKTTCECCGGSYSYSNKRTHFNTKKHKRAQEKFEKYQDKELEGLYAQGVIECEYLGGL
jgi:hypothetical protein